MLNLVHQINQVKIVVKKLVANQQSDRLGLTGVSPQADSSDK